MPRRKEAGEPEAPRSPRRLRVVGGVDPEDQGIVGSETQDAGSVVIKHDWSLSRKNIGP